tara:strand:- start:1716 stop:4382 length:2667 start_codon:yes stop_codon:yes gene_type:complete
MGLLNIGASGLLASQTAINTTGNNIANANVDGYSRQQAVPQTRSSIYDQGGFIGTGVDIETVRRITDQFINQQVLIDSASYAEFDILASQLANLEKMIGGDETGLSTSLENFFSALKAASDNVTSDAARKVVLSQADALAKRFNKVAVTIAQQQSMVNEQIVKVADQINIHAKKIADLNQQIINRQVSGSGDETNNLLDKRDNAMRSLAELISFSTVQSGDSVNIYIGAGQPLVIDGTVNKISITDDTLNVGNKAVMLEFNGRQTNITDRITGGKLGGLIQYRDQMLKGIEGTINRLSLSITQMYNLQHQAGIDRNGKQGGNFFSSVNSDLLVSQRIIAASSNASAGSQVTTVSIMDANALDASQYRLVLSGASTPLNYSLTRLEDKQVVASGLLANGYPQSIQTGQGFSIHLDSGTYQTGDQFYINPSASGARQMSLAIQSSAELALASPLKFEALATNSGTAKVLLNDTISVADMDLSALDSFLSSDALLPPLLIRFTSASTYDVLDNSDPTNPQQLDPPIRNQSYKSGSVNHLLPYSQGSLYWASDSPQVFSANTGPTGTMSNGFPGGGSASEVVTLTTIDPLTGSTAILTHTINSGDSADVIAARLSNIDGVSATASTSLLINVTDDGDNNLLEMSLNGTRLNNTLPFTNENLANQINAIFSGQSITAEVIDNQLLIRSFTGQDLKLSRIGGEPDDRVLIRSVNGGPLTRARLDPNEETVAGGIVEIVTDKNTSMKSSGSLFGSAIPKSMAVFSGYPLTITGTPAAGDRFLISGDADAQGDNRNALALQDLQTLNIFKNGTMSFSDEYQSAVTSLGSQTQAAQINESASKLLLEQSQSRRESISGVNLDEEAARLIEFQHAYSASAQVINTARDIFQTLLGVFN